MAAAAFALGAALAWALVVAAHTRRAVTDEAMWRSIFDFAPDGYVVLDIDGTLRRVNRAARELVGYSLDDASHVSAFGSDFLPAEDIERILSAIGDAEIGRVIGPIDLRLKRKDGRTVNVEASAYPIEERGRKLFLTIIRDVTERKAVAERLRLSTARLAKAQSVAQLGTWEYDLRADTFRAETDSEPIVPLRMAVGRLPIEEAFSLVHPNDRGRLREVLDTLLSGNRRRVAAEYLQRGIENEWIVVRTVAEAEVDEHGELVRLVGATQDVTDMRRTEQKVRELNAQLERRVRERTDELERAVSELRAFSYSVSHDLRTPLRAMAGYAEEVLRRSGDALDDTAKDDLGRIQSASVRMASMIDDLQLLSRLVRARRHVRRVDMSALARSLAAEFSKAHPDHAVDVTVADDVEAWGDESMMRIVLQNLIGNAWKFTRTVEGPSIEFGVQEEEDGERRYFVRDNGIGFEPEFAKKIFGTFERLHESEEFEGTGIGLATVERVVGGHSGRAWAEAEPGCGATFYFTLGTDREQSRDSDEDEAPSATAGETTAPAGNRA